MQAEFSENTIKYLKILSFLCSRTKNFQKNNAKNQMTPKRSGVIWQVCVVCIIK